MPLSYHGNRIDIRQTGAQAGLKVTALADGSFVAVWTQDSGDPDIHAQLFHADGTPKAAPFQVNTTDGGEGGNVQKAPVVTALGNGGFAVAWHDGSGAAGTPVRARVYGADGNADRPDFVVAQVASGSSEPSYAIASHGSGFVVSTVSSRAGLNAFYDQSGEFAFQSLLPVRLGLTFESVASLGPLDLPPSSRFAGKIIIAVIGKENSESVIVMSSYDARSGELRETWTLPASSNRADIVGASLTALVDGTIVLTRLEDRWDNGQQEIVFELHHPDGSERTVEINPGIIGTPVVAALPDGGFVLAYEDSDSIIAQTFSPVGEEKEIIVVHGTAGQQGEPTITMMPDGRFLVGWKHVDAGIETLRAQFVDPRSNSIVWTGTAANEEYAGRDDALSSDVLDGGAGDDRLYGMAGDDVLLGQAGGNDRFFGGAGRDTVRYRGARESITIDLATGLKTGAAAGDVYDSIEVIEGTDHDDALRGDGAANTLLGGKGNDTLDGGAGNDVLEGGEGDDLLKTSETPENGIYRGADSFDGGDGGADKLAYWDVRNAAQTGVIIYLLAQDRNGGAANGDRIVNIEIVDGTIYDDTIEGNDSANALWGNDANDILKGHIGSDTLTGGKGNDLIEGGADHDSLKGSEGNDNLEGGEGNDTFEGGDGDDFMSGGAGGRDTFFGGAGRDTVSYWSATGRGVVIDLVTGHRDGAATGDSYDGIEVIDGSGHADSLYGNNESNVFWGDKGNDVLEGREGADTLNGGEGNDVLNGGNGNNRLIGGAGNDILVSGASGNDHHIGGTGDDTYRIDASDTVLEIAGEGTDTLAAYSSYTLAAGVAVEILTIEPNELDIDLTGNEIGNVFHGNRGANRIDGGGGSDTLVLTGRRADYAATLNADGSVTLTDKREDEDGTDTILNVEIFQFTDSKLSLLGLVGDVGRILTGDVVAENSSAGVSIGSFLGSAKAGGPLRYELLTDAEGRFALDAATGVLKVADGVRLDFEQSASHTISVRVTDAGGISTTKTLTILVQDVLDERAFGSLGADRMHGGAGQDYFSGLAGSDWIDAGLGNDRIDAGLDNDWIDAGLGNDTLIGGLGKDTLAGGLGKDIFVFDTKANKAANLDQITDFVVADDTIWLDNAVFRKLGKKGSEAKPAKLDKTFLVIGDKAKDKDDYLIYSRKKGVLYYDADGAGKGKAVEIAILKKNLKMTNADFFVI